MLPHACPQLRVNTVHEKGSIKYTPQESLDDAGGKDRCFSSFISVLITNAAGGNLNAASRQALMQKLARTDQPAARPQPM